VADTTGRGDVTGPGGPDQVEWVGAPAVRPLRAAVLRAGRPVSEAALPGDDHPGARHAAVCGPDGVVACGSIFPEAVPWDPAGPPGWRIRGMATAEGRRREGLGGAVLDALLGHVAANGGGIVWCNARLRAQAFYARAGFRGRGERFDLPGIGPHIQVWREVEGDRSRR